MDDNERREQHTKISLYEDAKKIKYVEIPLFLLNNGKFRRVICKEIY